MSRSKLWLVPAAALIGASVDSDLHRDLSLSRFSSASKVRVETCKRNMVTSKSQEPDVGGLHVISLWRSCKSSASNLELQFTARRRVAPLPTRLFLVSVQLSSVCSPSSARPWSGKSMQPATRVFVTCKLDCCTLF
jgi:hypothetical protein